MDIFKLLQDSSLTEALVAGIVFVTGVCLGLLMVFWAFRKKEKIFVQHILDLRNKIIDIENEIKNVDAEVDKIWLKTVPDYPRKRIDEQAVYQNTPTLDHFSYDLSVYNCRFLEY